FCLARTREILTTKYFVANSRQIEVSARRRLSAREICQDGFGGAPSTEHCAVNRSSIAVVAGKVDTGADAHGSLRWFESTRKLLWLRVRDAIAFQMTPGTGDGAEPIFRVRDDEAAELLVGKLLRGEDGDGDQRFS